LILLLFGFLIYIKIDTVYGHKKFRVTIKIMSLRGQCQKISFYFFK
jgi:hypothetical protein